MQDLAKQLLKDGHAVSEKYFHYHYVRVSDDLKETPRGTVFFNDDVVYGYPHVGRILTLSQGLKQHFSERFSGEEKIDGYNIRIFLMDDEPAAMTRGGYICPFSTDRLKDLMDISVFQKYPDLVIYGEIAGPENPYNSETPPFIKEDVQLFIFDLGKKNQKSFFSSEEKYRLLEAEGLPAVHSYGKFHTDDIDAIKNIMLDLNEREHEGIVLKEDSKRNHRAKFVTANSSINDIRITSLFFQDVSPDYFYNRIAQIGLFYSEMDMNPPDDIYEKLGRSFLEEQKKALDMYKETGHVSHVFSCRFRSKNAAYQMLERLKTLHPHGGIHKISLIEDNDFWILKFERIFQKTTGLFGYFLGGGLVFD